jgi:hypothetical protein
LILRGGIPIPGMAASRPFEDVRDADRRLKAPRTVWEYRLFRRPSGSLAVSNGTDFNLDYSCVIVARVLRWRQIEVFEQIAPDREATGKLPNRIAVAIPRMAIKRNH